MLSKMKEKTIGEVKKKRNFNAQLNTVNSLLSAS